MIKVVIAVVAFVVLGYVYVHLPVTVMPYVNPFLGAY